MDEDLISKEAVRAKAIELFGCIPLINEGHRREMTIDEFLESVPSIEIEPVFYAHWEDATCSRCGHNLSEICDADSYFCIGFNENDYVACPFCGAKIKKEA